MRLHNFFIDQKIGDSGTVIISDSDLIHQWRHVFRFNTGSSVVLFDGSGFEFTAQFSELNYLKAVFIILEKRKNKFAPKAEVILFLSLIKADKFEWVLEKATELGVAGFCPVLTSRSVAKKINFPRARKIIIESSEQSGRGVLPTISEIVSLSDAVSLAHSSSSVALDPSGSYLDSLRSTLHASRYAIFIGPEGGFTDQELAIFRDKKIPIVSLGSQILRAETAAVAVSSLLLL